MRYLERHIHEQFSRLQNAPGTITNGASVPSTATAASMENSISDTGMEGTPWTPFAEVNSVEREGPADQAGLRVGDLVRGFGNVHWLNHQRLSKVAETVQQNEGVSGDYT